MTRFGYTLMTEQSGPKELVAYAEKAEQVGFDFEVMSDHYFPWLSAQGHAPYAWSVLGAVAHVTNRVELYTYVTCPTMRYHPAVVAQKAATIQLLADGRFTLGLGSGENLNEHVIGQENAKKTNSYEYPVVPVHCVERSGQWFGRLAASAAAAITGSCGWPATLPHDQTRVSWALPPRLLPPEVSGRGPASHQKMTNPHTAAAT